MQRRVIKDRYELIEQLGHGGMGSVWRANDRNLSIEVAVKLIQSEGAEPPEARARFEREALAAAQLRSTHIVLITDHGVDVNTPFIVMELLRGESLAKRLNDKGRLSFDQTLTYFTQIGDALAFAHERKIVHRDLKPDNVFIVSERNKEVVKVLDFGVAKKLDAQSFGNKVTTHTGTLLGTPYYMSPEQTRGIAAIDHRSDLWAFGVMAYECMTGRRPFDAATLPDLLMAICRDPCSPPSQVALVPRGFDEWFARATARERGDRFGNIEEALDGLSALQGAQLVGNVTPIAVPDRFDDPVPIIEQGASSTPVLAQEPTTQVAARVPQESSQACSSAGPLLHSEATLTVGAHSVVPSSITAPGGHTKPVRRSSPVWIWPVLGLCVVVTGYALWPNSSQNPTAVNAIRDTEVLPSNVVKRRDAVAPSPRIEEKSPQDSVGRDAPPKPGEPQNEDQRAATATTGSAAVANLASVVASVTTKPSVVTNLATPPNAESKPSVASKATVVLDATAAAHVQSKSTQPALATHTQSKSTQPALATHTQSKSTQPALATYTQSKSTQPRAPVARPSGATAAQTNPAPSQPNGTDNSWGL